MPGGAGVAVVRRRCAGLGPLPALRPFPGAAPRTPLGAPPPDPRASNAGGAGGCRRGWICRCAATSSPRWGHLPAVAGGV
ncbi:hypothetical protein EF910_31125 [Streptomyces sp. WAC07149]|nr:hypothetical protein EF910_31125 [Streptomyces sp. WAC07149]